MDPTAYITSQMMSTLRQIGRAMDLHSRYLNQQYGLTIPQLSVLIELSAIGEAGVNAGQLAKAVHLSQATVTGILLRLEKRGLVQRVRSEFDRRRVVVTLTDAARQVLEQAPPLLQERFTGELVKLDPWEQTNLLTALQRVVQMMKSPRLETIEQTTPSAFTEPSVETVQPETTPY